MKKKLKRRLENDVVSRFKRFATTSQKCDVDFHNDVSDDNDVDDSVDDGDVAVAVQTTTQATPFAFLRLEQVFFCKKTFVDDEKASNFSER